MHEGQKDTLNERSALMRFLADDKVLIIFSILASMAVVGLSMSLGVTPVLAGSNTSGSTASSVITTGFANLQSIVEAIVTAIGAILLLWGLFEWGISIQSPDGVQQSSAFKRIGGGVVMIAAPQLLAFFV